MAKIEIQCTECGHEARVPEAFKGKKVRCLRCHAKLRVPGEEGGAASEAASGPTSESRQTVVSGESARHRRERPLGNTTGTGASKVRREVQQSIREVLGDYEHAIESTPRGFDVDLRGVAFGLARTLAEDLLQAPGVRDVKLSGGTGECRLTLTVEGALFSPDDSFADDDDDTELFQRPSAPGPVPFEERERPAGSSSEQRGLASSERGAPASSDRKSVGTSSERRPRSNDADRPRSNDAERPRSNDSERPRSSDAGPPSTSGSRRARESAVERPAASTSGSRRSTDRPRSDAGQAGGGDRDRLTAEGERLLEEGDPRAASEVLERVVSVDKNHVPAVKALGEAYARLGDSERARRAFRHLAKLVPDDPEPLILHAAALVQCDRLEDARLSLADAIKLDPENARAYKYAAALYDRLGDPDRSRKFREDESLKGR